MSIRVLYHIFFWMTYVTAYVILNMLFAAPSDLAFPPVQRFFRFFIKEIVFLPWKIIPFYFLFYFLIPRYFQKGTYLKIGLYFLATLILCLFGYRSMIGPVNNMMYGEAPGFNVYSIKRLLFSLTDILPPVGLAATVKLLKGSIISQKKEQALQREKLESELNFLKAQTNPHFLFNTLNNLYGLARNNDQNTAPSIMKLANIMRYILYECSAEYIPIQKEIKTIEDYIELEKLRYDERLRVNFEKNIDDWELQIAPLILLPFVENAFKHGASENRFDIQIDINIEATASQLLFSVWNNRDTEEAALIEGIGLKNAKRQLELIYGKKYTLEIVPEQHLFSVKLLIHFDQHES